MTPEQALAVLNQLASLAPANRQDHLTAVQAVETLNAALRAAAAAAVPVDPEVTEGPEAEL